MEKLVETLFIITCFIVITCGCVYLNSKIIKHIDTPSCTCTK